MAIAILSELNSELTRLFVAGSRLCNGDPRLKKYVDPLGRMGEKAPVLLRLATLLEELLDTPPELSARKLLETEAFLLSILSTQGDPTDKNRTPGDKKENPAHASLLADRQYSSSGTTVSYRRLSPVLTALSTSGGGRMQALESALELGFFCDPRLAQPVADALASNSPDVTGFLIADVLPVVGTPIVPYLLSIFNSEGNVADARKLRALYKLMAERALSLAQECFDSGSPHVKIEAANILGDFPQCETLLLGGLGGKKDVREAVMKSLIRMDSHAGIDKILELRDKPEAVSAITNGDSPYLVDRILEMLRDRGVALEAGAKTPDDLRLFAEALEFLRNKKSEPAAVYLQALLTGGLLENLKNPLPQRGEKLTDTTLDILFQTGHGGDFIWEMFRSTQQGRLGKLFGGKKDSPVMLPLYAFSIGAVRLDPEVFYDVFFKSQLYQEVIKLDRNAFAEAFLSDGSPPFSRQVAGYFAKSGDTILAVRTVASSDTGALNTLADLLKDNLEKNKYGYENDLILERLGRAGFKRFATLYKLFCEKNHGSAAFRENLSKYLDV